MKIEQIGWRRYCDLDEQPNLLRLFVENRPSRQPRTRCGLGDQPDDVTGEVLGYATAKVWEAGALDVYSTAIQMKKNRPGIKLSVLAQGSDLARIEKILFRETGTLGVRRWLVSRHKLERKPHTVETAFGPVTGKLGWIAGESPSFSPEYEACRQLAEQRGVPLREVYEAAQQAFSAAPN